MSGIRQDAPRLQEPEQGMGGETRISGSSSGHIQIRTHLRPKQGGHMPQLNTQYYPPDRKLIGTGPLEDGPHSLTNPA